MSQHYALWMEEKGLNNWRNYFLPPIGNVDRFVCILEEFQYDAWIIEKTNALMDEYNKSNENFFLWSSFFDPHLDCLTPELWDTMHNPDELIISLMKKVIMINTTPFFNDTVRGIEFFKI